MIHFWKKLTAFLAAMVLLAWNVFSVNAFADELDDTIAAMEEQEAETQATISDLEKQTKETRDAIAALQGQRAETENTVNALSGQSAALQNTIRGYSNQLDDLNEEITAAESAMAEVSSQIVQLNNELSGIQKEREERYALLKKRLKSVYENGGTQGMLRIFLNSGSFQEYLTTGEYLSAIVEYDRRQIAAYQALEEQLAQKIAEVEQKEAELDAYQDTLDEKHEALADLTDEVQSQLNSTNSSISSEKGKLADYDRQLSDLDSKMKALESQTAAAQAALAKQIAERLALRREDTSGSYAASDSELQWLAATIQAEADGESYTGKLAVGSVILNRVKSSAFPNTIVGVITQNMQFASYRSGKVELIMSKGPNSTCVRAAEEVLGGARVGDYLFFMTKYYADYYGISEYTMIGNHAFFYRWVTKPKAEPEPASEAASAPENTDQNTDSQSSEETGEPSGDSGENAENSGGNEEGAEESPEIDSAEENTESGDSGEESSGEE